MKEFVGLTAENIVIQHMTTMKIKKQKVQKSV